jgi:hypothetical protein
MSSFRLTGYLEGSEFQKTDEPRHPDITPCIKPTGSQVVSKPHCQRCPKELDHPSYGRGWRTTAAPQSKLIIPEQLRHLQYLVQSLGMALHGIEGSAPGYLLNAIQGFNYATSFSPRISTITEDYIETEWPKVDGVNPRFLTWNAARSVPEGALFYLTSAQDQGPIAPGDYLKFPYPSCKENLLVARVQKVEISETSTKWLARLYTGGDCRGVLASSDPENPTPAFYTVQIWRNAAPFESFFRVVTPEWRKCWRRRYWFNVSDLAGTGVVALTRSDGTEGAIGYPEAANPAASRAATFFVRKFSTTSQPVDITAVARARVQILENGAGADGLGRFKTRLCFKEVDALGNEFDGAALYDPETEPDVFGFEVFAWVEATDIQIARNMFRFFGNKCEHAIKDNFKNSFNTGPGTAVDTAGNSHYCRLINYPVKTVTIDSEGEPAETTEWHEPTGKDFFRPHCNLLNLCDKFAPIERAGEGNRYFTIFMSFARWHRELWNSIDMFYRKPPLPVRLSVGRRRHKSILELFGSFTPEEWQIGAHDHYYFPHIRSPKLCGDFAVETDGEGNETISPIRGAFFDIAHFDVNDVAIDSESTYPGPGILPTEIEGWTEKVDPFGNAFTDATDPWRDIRYSDLYSGHSLQINDGTDSGARSIARKSANYGNMRIFAPEIVLNNPDLFDTWQERGEWRVMVLSEPETHPDGFQARIVAEYFPPRTTGKEPTQVADGVVATAVVSGSKIVLEFENKPNSYSVFTVIGPGNTFDKIISWYGAFGVVSAPVWMAVNSPDSADATRGMSNRKLWIGDAIQFEGEIEGIVESEKQLWPVWRAKGAGGEQAVSWGSEIERGQGPLSGYFQAAAANLLISEDNYGSIEGVTLEVAGAGYPNSSSFGELIELTAVAMVPVGAILKNIETGELLKVVSADTTNAEITVERGRGGTATAAGLAGHHLQLQMVTRRADDTPFTILSTATRPTIPAGSCWKEVSENRFYFNQADLDEQIAIAYHVSGKGDDSTSAYREEWVVGAANPAYNATAGGYSADLPTNGAYLLTDFVHDTLAGFSRTVHIATTEQEETASNPPASGEYREFETGAGEMCFQSNLVNAGRSMRVAIETGGEAAAPGDVPGMPPEYGTGIEWGRRMDRAEIFATPALLAQVDSLPGRTIVAIRNGHGICPSGTFNPIFTPYQGAEFTTIGTAESRTAWGVYDEGGGRAKMWLSNNFYLARIAANQNRVCIGAD